MTSWGRLEDTLHDEPKFYRAAQRLGISFVEVAGHMAVLWSWAHRHAPDGDLRDYDVPDIERAAKWDGDPGVFVAVLVDDRVNLIDETTTGYVLHRFMQRAEARKAAQKKKRQRVANESKRKSVIYVIERGDGPVKIGFTTDLSRRMSEYQNGRARLVAFCDGDSALETALHGRFAASRIGRTEFFERTPEIDEWIGTLTQVSRDTNANDGRRVPEERRGEEKEKRGEIVVPAPAGTTKGRSAEQQARSKAVNRRYRERYEEREGHPPAGTDQQFNGIIARFSDKYADAAILILDWFFDSPDNGMKRSGWAPQLLFDQAPRLWRELNDKRKALENIAAPAQARIAARNASLDIEVERANEILAKELAR